MLRYLFYRAASQQELPTLSIKVHLAILNISERELYLERSIWTVGAKIYLHLKVLFKFYLLNNQLVEEFFTRHENIRCIDAANLLRSIGYARIIASQTILQEKSLYKSGGNSDFCRICPDFRIKRTQGNQIQ